MIRAADVVHCHDALASRAKVRPLAVALSERRYSAVGVALAAVEALLAAVVAAVVVGAVAPLGREERVAKARLAVARVAVGRVRILRLGRADARAGHADQRAVSVARDLALVARKRRRARALDVVVDAQ